MKPAIKPYIGTWPTPERAGFRFERFFLDKLLEVGAIDQNANANARFQLASAAIGDAERAGDFFEQVPEECHGPHSAPWCDIATAKGVVVTEGRTLLVDSLAANGFVDHLTSRRWREIARTHELSDFAPSLFQQMGTSSKDWKVQRGLEILDQAFVATSGASIPVPGSDFERHCHEHPEDPMCWIASASLGSHMGRVLTRELAIISLLQSDELLHEYQAAAIYDAYERDVSVSAGIRDISHVAGGIIVEGMPKLEREDRAEIAFAVARRRGAVGYVDPDSPWAEICSKPSPPPICPLIREFPAAAALTSELVRREIWPGNDALQAWDEVGQFLK